MHERPEESRTSRKSRWYRLKEHWARSRDDPRGQLINARFSELHARWVVLRLKAGDRPEARAVVEEIERLIAGERAWEAALRIELCMIPLLDEDELLVELQHTAAKIESHGVEATVPHDRSLFESASAATRGALLKTLVSDLHWYYNCRRVEDEYRNRTRSRAARFLVYAVFLFFLPELLSSSPLEIHLLEINTAGYYAFTAMLAGILGATFSMLSSLESRMKGLSINDLRGLHSYWTFAARILVGMIGGLLVFYAIHGGLLGGSFFPELPGSGATASGPAQRMDLSWKNKALLQIWCFIGGFSEGFVARFLAKTVSQGATADARG